jgi:hypothetical protein
MNPLVQSLEKSQLEFSKIVSDSIRQTLDSANLKLAAQIESSLNRQLRIPIENLADRLVNTTKVNSEIVGNRSERLRKIAESQKISQNSTNLITSSVNPTNLQQNSDIAPTTENGNFSKVISS